MKIEIQEVLKPENELEQKIIDDADFQTGVMWGKPRNGHPEGKVLYHVREVLDNVDKYAPVHLREKLRLIAFIHDTFKHKVDTNQSKSGENHHATIARRFAEKHIDDTAVLDIIQLHDEAYNAWQKGNRDGKWDKAETRLNNLLEILDVNLNLYSIFYKCDNETGDKSQDNYKWFMENFITDKI